MGYLLLGLLAVILVLMGIAVLRTLMIKAPAPAVCDTVITEEECATAAQKLGAMVQVPSVSKNEDEDLTEFYKLHAVMEAQFPLIHQKLEKTDLRGNLLYRWSGADSTKLPILLMGHQDVVPASNEGWRVDAYSGAVIDGNLYGRGALDCKSTMYVELQAVEELLEEGFVPPCDVYLSYSINEETGGDGAAAAVRHLKAKGITLALHSRMFMLWWVPVCCHNIAIFISHITFYLRIVPHPNQMVQMLFLGVIAKHLSIEVSGHIHALYAPPKPIAFCLMKRSP